MMGDTCTTSHVINNKDAFINYKPLKGKAVRGVGNLVTHAEGQGTVQIESNFDGKKFISTLENVLYIPTNRHNLLALGRWDKSSGRIDVHHGKLSLISASGQVVAQGERMDTNLYHMDIKVLKPGKSCATSTTSFAYTSSESPQSWETWHRRFGHIGYDGIQHLLDRGLVDGLQIDVTSPKPDCQACTESKQFVKPFPRKAKHRSDKNGQLTHIDLSGKFPVTSIDGSQYFINFVDDKSRMVTVEGLKHKHEATQKVKNYITYLQTHGMTPQTVRFDEGGEFISKELSSWFQQRGMTVQETAPYSPSQNGVPERMN